MRWLLFGVAFLILAPVAAAAAGNAASGKTVYARCAICHTANKGGPNRIGPNLFGVVGRKAGTLGGYNFSAAMKKYAKAWSPQVLDAYLAKPQMTVPGTKMAFAGISNPAQRADVIAYLQTLK